MNGVRNLFSFRNRVIFVSAILVPEHFYGLGVGDLPAEVQDTAFASLVLTVTILALVVLAVCWAQVSVELFRSRSIPGRQRLIWAMAALLAPYGLIAYYWFFHKRLIRQRGWNNGTEKGADCSGPHA